MSDVTVVKAFLDAFSAGDLPGALELLHDDVHASEPAGLPTGGEYKGKGQYIGFLEKTGATYDVKIHSTTLIDGGEFTVAVIESTWTSRATGTSLDMQLCELYTVDDGKIVKISVFPKDSRALYELTVAA